MSAENQTLVLVTGSNRGIGFEVCRQLARAGMMVILTARDPAKADSAAHQLRAEGLAVRPYALDITQDESIATLATTLERDFGRLDVLVNNAATYPAWSEQATSADLKVAHDVFETNIFGAWRVSQALLPLIRKSPHGRIVNVSSGAGSHGDQQFGLTTSRGSVASYAISKAALNALTAAFASELAGAGILVNAVCPGATATTPDMAARGARPIEEGAASIIWAVTLPDAGPTGGFFRDGRVLSW